MTVKQARMEGLQFTGKYESNWSNNLDSIKEQAKLLRKQGYKAYVVTEESGKSVYVERKYFIDDSIMRLERNINGLAARKQRAYEKYLEELKELEEENERNKERIAKLKEERETR